VCKQFRRGFSVTAKATRLWLKIPPPSVVMSGPQTSAGQQEPGRESPFQKREDTCMIDTSGKK
jgi:hypothetical protein